MLGPAASVVANFQAAEAIKILAGRARDARASLLQADVWSGEVRTMQLPAAPSEDCPCCAERRFEFLDSVAGPSAALCGRDAVQVSPSVETRLDLDALALRLAEHGTFARTRFSVRGSLAPEQTDCAEQVEVTIFADARAIFRGVRTPERARALYARYIGS